MLVRCGRLDGSVLAGHGRGREGGGRLTPGEQRERERERGGNESS